MYANKLYHHDAFKFEMQTDSNGDRVFQAANSGLVLESFQLLDSLWLVMPVIKAMCRGIPYIVTISSLIAVCPADILLGIDSRVTVYIVELCEICHSI
jgi:hypothetical protein